LAHGFSSGQSLSVFCHPELLFCHPEPFFCHSDPSFVILSVSEGSPSFSPKGDFN